MNFVQYNYYTEVTMSFLGKSEQCSDGPCLEHGDFKNELFRGHDGLNGNDGLPGRDGLPGSPGRDGRDGLPGSPGRDGLPGSPGKDGLDAVDGLKGDKGEKGVPGETGSRGPVSGGATYTRWGTTECPTTVGTTLIYSGRAGKAHFTHKGGGGNYQCMPDIPEYGKHAPGGLTSNVMYGVEYDVNTGGPLTKLHDHNVPCAVCYVSTRAAVLMIPAWLHCPNKWTLEYSGYLMSEHNSHTVSTYECVDSNAVPVPGSSANINGGLFWHVKVNCEGLLCPPYAPEKELTCVVCTL